MRHKRTPLGVPHVIFVELLSIFIVQAGAPLEAQQKARYVAYVSVVSSADRDAYVSHLEGTGMPVWRSLQRDGLLLDRMVLEQTSVLTEIDGLPPWNFLQLARLAEGIAPEEFLEAERERLNAAGFAPPGQLLRVEFLETTPKSFYPMPSRSSNREEPRLEFVVEYINVFDGFLGEYRTSMVLNSGPAIGILIDDGLMYAFFALETRSVHYARDEMPRWNQIHVNADVAGIEVSEEVWEGALREVNPECGGIEGVFGRLDQIRDKPKETKNRELSILRIENTGASRERPH
jgi:hypothetical protein